ncbi:hypothetical protein [Eptesicus fuscus gammaherpesvirus]|uniref:Cytoplasmic envelopment protein 3 n=1 Tax=vespertilionid gammaherpesvirus 3 TaxID=2846598 RepID=A0A2D0ZNW9_9GAMA|nr:hypothetical protein [Eptesicus fuscus gammaherpesvirus]ATA58267.1 hypothetical protein [Eptesicus fuscus gammaherpesvirus]WAH70933.1 DNA packaging terminase [Eptesicus fuscus gammaherpesvirus]
MGAGLCCCCRRRVQSLKTIDGDDLNVEDEFDTFDELDELVLAEDGVKCQEAVQLSKNCASGSKKGPGSKKPCPRSATPHVKRKSRRSSKQ